MSQLIRNNQDFLPIDLTKVTQIALIGELANQLKIGDKTIFSILKKATNIEVEYSYSKGYLNTNEVNETVMNEAQRAASIADIVIIFVGFINETEGKNATKLPTPQNVLVDVISQVNKNIIAVILADANVKMPWEKQVKSILQLKKLDSEFVNLIFKTEEK